MNLLIVDDEYFSVENIKGKLDWQSLDFEQVFCAYSVKEAQEIFANHIIDVLLCDIEMPKASGLDLLAWIREKEMQTVCIFLTCFAEFSYANRALKLESSDYLLKPISQEELLSAIQKAIGQRRQKEAEKTNQIYSDYWLRSDVQRTERFWRNLTMGEYLSDRRKIEKAITNLHLAPEMMQARFMPLLIKYYQTGHPPVWEAELFEYALKNILNEIFSKIQNNVTFVKTHKNRLFLPFLYEVPEKETVLHEFQTALKTCRNILPAHFKFYVGRACGIETMFENYQQLSQYAYNDVSQCSDVFLTEDTVNFPPVNHAFPTDEWVELLMSRKINELRRQALTYVREISKRKNASRTEFLDFFHDFSQILYAFLDKKGAPAHKLFVNGNESDTAEHACDNLVTIENWITQILICYTEVSVTTDESNSVIEDVKKYISSHLSEDITRTDLAQAVFLSPDYLSHLFKEKTESSLTVYITKERIKKSKELLMNKKLSIRDIALASGFQNISYFSKQFKRATGQTPQNFRKGSVQ